MTVSQALFVLYEVLLSEMNSEGEERQTVINIGG